MQIELDRLSRMRQALSDLAREVELMMPVFMDRLPMVKGTVYQQRRKCGKPNCRCRTGKEHSTMMLSRSEGGRTKLVGIPKGQLKEVQILARRSGAFSFRSLRRQRWLAGAPTSRAEPGNPVASGGAMRAEYHAWLTFGAHTMSCSLQCPVRWPDCWTTGTRVPRLRSSWTASPWWTSGAGSPTRTARSRGSRTRSSWCIRSPRP